MSWTVARGEIAAVLAAITDATGGAAFKAVYEKPVGSVQSWPSVMVYPPVVEIERFGGWRRKAYTPRLRVIVSDKDLHSATDQVDDLRERVIDAFDSATRLHGTTVEDAEIQRTTEAVGFEYAGKPFTGVDCFLRVAIKESYDFAP